MEQARNAAGHPQVSVIDEYVVQMELPGPIIPPDPPTLQSSSSSREEQDNTDDVCYPFPEPQVFDSSNTLVIQTDALYSFINNDGAVYESHYPIERQLTAKLDDLLDASPGNVPLVSSTGSLRGEVFKGSAVQKTAIDRCTFYSVDLGSVKGQSLRDLLTMRAESKERTVSELLLDTSCWWIDIFAPTNEEMRALSKIFRIHPLTTEDIQAQESREKCEIFQNYMFVSFRSFNHDIHSPNYLEAVNFYIIVFKDGVLTFRFQPLPHPHNVRRRIHQLKDFIHITPEWINYALIDSVTDSFAPLIQQTELEVDSIDDLVLVLNGSEQRDMLRRIGSCRKTVMQLLRLLGPKADVVRSLIKRYDDKSKEAGTLVKSAEAANDTSTEESKIHHEVILYLGDIQDHILTMLQNVNHYDLTLGRAHRNYLGQISIEVSQAGNTTNEVINRLTFFATIVVPLNLVAGLFGMNVQVPGQSNHDLVWFFWIVLGMLMYVVAMVAMGKRSGFV
ncbi:CorA metal ion transporter [Apophysomyces sp. BC1034]|nr:CorA metal ion transporter [Apophysomyces sp. BC1015]KAG0179658.1 CorA metal ion transporter [Apophysomyces sp. BC1021]KAG0189985.1 CorA metal ion transporter [Apophysomyces sp. BC1034]